jgi:hypothetical protein
MDRASEFSASTASRSPTLLQVAAPIDFADMFPIVNSLLKGRADLNNWLKGIAITPFQLLEGPCDPLMSNVTPIV